MRKGIILTVVLAVLGLFFVSCQGTPKTTAHGKENIGYLQITGDVGEMQSVTVIIDDTEPFTATVNDNSRRNVKNKYTYKIAVGAHDIEVRYNDRIITKRKIFVSANEIKVVEVS